MKFGGKILTLIGIVLIFGYFIYDSFRVPTASNPEAIILVGNDTLGRDWGAQAAQLEQASFNNRYGTSEENANAANPNLYGTGPLINESNDPYLQDKFNSADYSTEMSLDGREIVTDYNNPFGKTSFDEEEMEEQNSLLYNNEERYKTRHQTEVGEPQMRYKD